MAASLLATLFLSLTLQSALDQAKQAVAEQRWKDAGELLLSVLQTEPDNGEAHYYLAQVYGRTGPERLAIDHFLTALEVLPEQEVIWSEYAKWLLSAGYYAEAQRVGAELTLRWPTGDNWRLFGLATYQNGDPEVARRLYRRALNSGFATGEDYYLIGLAARAMGDFDAALGYFVQGLEIDSRHQELSFQTGDLHLKLGEPEAALKYLNALDSSHPEGNYSRGVALFQLDRLDEARRSLEKYVEQRPSDPRGHYQLANLCLRLGDEAKSQAEMRRFRELEAIDRERRKTKVKKEVVRPPRRE